ncbi:MULTISPECIES: type II toxin-antitoxin system VapC family toxin [Methylobacterium]|uniref:PIN domain-containing protein n=1 Tax=Methylobacterium thuringiense TaxID=1003091 RepID=A0ABQ4TLN5_9HYPH|nr:MULTISPECIES: type II toxin-antitoxin system VapC family toxin [Methylobacterium]TXN24163.1 type II toxin-antitoxin system VapC family toxin [Methylobacterium sp. WL9]GJE56290.1 hypothetical protein EKPJFOCH_2791 [Methylobacterium thuringiense]
MSKADFVLDASALLCILFEEPGAASVEAVLDRACISAVNYAEVVAKMVDRGQMAEDAIADLRELCIVVEPFDGLQAGTCGALRAATGTAGLSLGDRACLALAASTNAVAITADRASAKIQIGVRIEVVR